MMRSISCVQQRMVIGVALAVAAGTAAASTARAERGSASAEASPSTITLDRMDESSRLGLQVGFDKGDSIKLSDGFFMRYEPYGQYVLPNQIVGFFGQMAISHIFNYAAGRSPDYTALSNTDVGAFFMPTHTPDVILRLSLALPTGSESTNRRFVNGSTAYERLTDALLATANYTTLRMSASTVQEIGVAFFRADLGFDLVVDHPAGGGDPPTIFVRGNVAGGLRLPGVDLAAELVNFGAVNGTVRPAGITNRFLHTAAVGFSTRGSDQFRAGTVFPLDKSTRGDIWILSLGYQHIMN